MSDEESGCGKAGRLREPKARGGGGAQAVVIEFSPATASAMGLAWAHHEHCRAGMEAEFLPALFCHGRDAARGAAVAAAAAGGRDEGGVCAAAVSLLCAVLSWDFRRALHSALEPAQAQQGWGRVGYPANPNLSRLNRPGPRALPGSHCTAVLPCRPGLCLRANKP